MATENLFLKNAKENGLIDDREIAMVADVVCTNGNQGRAFVFLNGSIMNFYEMAGFAAWGAHVETVDLKNAAFVKASSFPLYTYLKFTCQGHTYTLKGFAQAKKVIAAITESCG